MTRNITILSLLFAGIAAAVLSFLLPVLMSAEYTWSGGTAENIQKTGESIQKKVNELAQSKDASQKKVITAEIEKLQAEFDQMQASLDGALKRPFWLRIACQVLGVGLVAGAFWLYYMVPMPIEKPKTLAELDPDGTLANKEVTALDYTKAVRTSRGKR